MQKNQICKLATSSIVILVLSGCATDAGKAGLNTGNVLATTQSTLNTAQSAVDTVKSVQQAASLTEALTQKLGVSSEQAAGGAGALLLAAQSRMKADDFQQLIRSMPEVGTLTKVVAKPKEISGWTQVASGASALMGDKNNTLGQAAGLVSSFQELGLSASMVQKYIPVVTDYVSKNAAPYLTKALVSALTGL